MQDSGQSVECEAPVGEMNICLGYFYAKRAPFCRGTKPLRAQSLKAFIRLDTMHTLMLEKSTTSQLSPPSVSQTRRKCS